MVDGVRLTGSTLTDANLKTIACTFAAYKAAERNEMFAVAEFYERQVQSGINAGGEK